MATDDLNAPLGQAQSAERERLGLPVAVAASDRGRRLALFVAVFVGLGDARRRPARRRAGGGRGGRPAGRSRQQTPTQRPPPARQARAAESRRPPTAANAPPARRPSPSSTASSGKRQEIVARRVRGRQDSKRGAPIDASGWLRESRAMAPMPKIAPDGARPSDVYARPIKPRSPASANAPRIAIVIGGLGIGASAARRMRSPSCRGR